jgi:hypothetical protein
VSQWWWALIYFLAAGSGSWVGGWIVARQVRRWNRRQDAKDMAELRERIRDHLSPDAARWQPKDE